MSNGDMIGWDAGGAHLKAVRINAQGVVQAAIQYYCPLWRGLDTLENALERVMRQTGHASHHAVTMTGELVDAFANRHEGVMQIARCLTDKLPGEVRFYAGNHGFVSLAQVSHRTGEIASMNWFASVECLATQINQGIFVDIGSTTTDIIPLYEGKAMVQGWHDAARLQSDELVYTGVVRTPLMAVAQKIAFDGVMTNIAAEHFATTADVYTLLGDLGQDDNMAETADGAEKTMQASMRRIARMVGLDAEDRPESAWRNLAYAFKHAQLEQIKSAVLRRISAFGECRGVPIIGAGAGDFLASDLARQLGLRYHTVTELISAEDTAKREQAAVCFPAYAVARLAAQKV